MSSCDCHEWVGIVSDNGKYKDNSLCIQIIIIQILNTNGALLMTYPGKQSKSILLTVLKIPEQPRTVLVLGLTQIVSRVMKEIKLYTGHQFWWTTLMCLEKV